MAAFSCILFVMHNLMNPVSVNRKNNFVRFDFCAQFFSLLLKNEMKWSEKGRYSETYWKGMKIMSCVRQECRPKSSQLSSWNPYYFHLIFFSHIYSGISNVQRYEFQMLKTRYSREFIWIMNNIYTVYVYFEYFP